MFRTFYQSILYLDMDTWIFQHVNKEIIWGDEMMGFMLLLMLLTSTQGKSQYQCKCIKTQMKI
jgi:hypothetical protein